jgi:prepilin-type N-terminal cleavage/methylation domain-containing protein
MVIYSSQNKEARFGVVCRAFTLVEVLMSLVLLSLVLAGVCYGYAQANRIAVWCSMSQAAQSFAVEGMEQARAAQWDTWDTNLDEMPASATNPAVDQPGFMDIPMKGPPVTGTYTNYTYCQTNYVFITRITNSSQGNFSPSLRQITSYVVWRFPLTGQSWTNTIVTLRASDE